MTIATVFGELKSFLPKWEKTGLNEAQTSQVIVMRVLQALNYDVWSPFEVCPQEVSNGNIPDFIVSQQNTRRFIVEVKKLGTNFTDTMKTQAVSYANNHAIRWAILTNGSDWLLFDSFLVKQPAHERLLLELSLKTLEAALMAQYLDQLLNVQIWQKSEDYLEQSANNIRNHIQLNNSLQPLALKLQQLMQEYTVQSLEAGLKLVGRLELWSKADLNLVNNNIQVFARLMGQRESVLSSTSARASQALIDVSQALKQGINSTRPLSRQAQVSDFEAYLNSEKLNATSWRDIHAGIAEAFLILGKSSELEENDFLYADMQERQKGDGSSYPPSAYRELSNGRYLLLHASADAHYKRSIKLLQNLGAPEESLKVIYKKKNYLLP